MYERLIKTVYQWSCQNRRGWDSKVKRMVNKLNITAIINNAAKSVKNIVKSVKDKLCANDKILWKNELIKSDSLRTYTKLNCYHNGTVLYHYQETISFFKFRSCTLHLHVETARHSMAKLPLNE